MDTPGMEWLLLPSALGCLAWSPFAGATCKRDCFLGKLQLSHDLIWGCMGLPCVAPGSLGFWLQGMGSHYPRLWGPRKGLIPAPFPSLLEICGYPHVTSMWLPGGKKLA